MNRKIFTVIAIVATVLFAATNIDSLEAHQGNQHKHSGQNGNGKMYQQSTTIEKERPELDEVTRQLIAAYRKNPNQANYDALRKQVAVNYDKVLEKKKAKLEELRRTARDQSKITEMEEIVNEMIPDRENRINQTMSSFTDSRLTPKTRTTQNGFLPILGAAQNAYISYTPITNEEYQKFISATDNNAPPHWTNKRYPINQGDYPVTGVSYEDAVAYYNCLRYILYDCTVQDYFFER